MKITILFTGGTIGSSVGEDGYISPNAECPYRLLDLYNSRYEPQDITFATKEPYRILSENLQAADINTLIKYIRETLEEGDSDGVIVTHGTDTLQYSAALVGYVFGQTSIPVVFVSSDFPLEDERANGLSNFAHAVAFIRGGFGRGVFASYENPGEIPQIHLGTRMIGHLPYSADMWSVENSIYGFFVESQDGEDVFVKNVEFGMNITYDAEKSICENENENLQKKQYSEKSEHVRICGNICEAVEKSEIILKECGKQILRIQPYPGMEYPELSSGTKVILHESYHSGTIAISQKLEQFAEKAKKLGILFYITGVPYQEREYETVREYERMGIKILPRMSPIAAYCKLWLILSCGKNPEELMDTVISDDLIFEVDENAMFA